jgi:hypothetical protein
MIAVGYKIGVSREDNHLDIHQNRSIMSCSSSQLRPTASAATITERNSEISGKNVLDDTNQS